MECVYCGSADLKSSHVHLADLPSLLQLKRPFRCKTCNGRMYLSFVVPLMSRFTKKREQEE
jgi:hypothetical protein